MYTKNSAAYTHGIHSKYFNWTGQEDYHRWGGEIIFGMPLSGTESI